MALEQPLWRVRERASPRSRQRSPAVTEGSAGSFRSQRVLKLVFHSGIRTCQYKFINCNRCSTQGGVGGGMWIMEEAMHMRGQGVYGIFLYLFSILS